ncbi:MAG: peptidase M23 [Betaproteobacteria bacterium]|nr:peptidase M23 [Betaproteobacteria bacterium]
MSRRACIVRLFVVATVVFPCPSRPAEPAELRDLRARIGALRVEIAGTEDARSEAREELRESEQSISQVNRDLRDLSRQRDIVRAGLRSLATRKSAIESEIAQRERDLGAMLAASYRQGEPSHLRLVLSGADPNQTARDLYYVTHILRSQASLMEGMRRDLASLRSIEAEHARNTRQIADIEGDQRARRAELVVQQAARRKVLERVSAQLRSQQREVKSLERDQTRLSRLVEEIGKVIASTPGPRGRVNEKLPDPSQSEKPFASLKGALRLPIRGVLTNRYGAIRPDGGPSWKGLFIKALAGEEVRAVAPGRIVFAEWMRGFGNLLILDHGADYLSIYGNNESLLRGVGEQVRAGDSVATVGASGGSQESGLYFEIRHEGRAFDPEKWLARR